MNCACTDPCGRRGINEAIKELSQQAIVADVPLALSAIRKILRAPVGKDTLRAAQTVIDKVLATKSEVKVDATSQEDTQMILLREFKKLRDLGVTREKLVETFGKFGVERLEVMLADNAKMIEGEVVKTVSEQW